MNNLITLKRNGDPLESSDTPSTPVSRLRWDWDRMFDHVLDDLWSPGTGSADRLPLDLIETDTQIHIRLEAPGMKSKDFEISLAGAVLHLSGEKRDADAGATGNRTWAERRFGSFRRAVRLPCPVDPEKVKAEYRDGVLSVTLEKAESLRTRRIPVQPG
jgi:HSP20 family protein